LFIFTDFYIPRPLSCYKGTTPKDNIKEQHQEVLERERCQWKRSKDTKERSRGVIKAPTYHVIVESARNCHARNSYQATFSFKKKKKKKYQATFFRLRNTLMVEGTTGLWQPSVQ
jgi:hypothetical protein